MKLDHSRLWLSFFWNNPEYWQDCELFAIYNTKIYNNNTFGPCLPEVNIIPYQLKLF